MAKFSNAHVLTRPPVGPTVTTVPALNHEGGLGYAQDVFTELFTLAVVNMVGETSFYESAGDRDARFRRLVHQATTRDAEWTAAFIGWLRDGANMRSASVVAACEYVLAGGPHGRAVIDSACRRADEPGEILGYWLSTRGRRVPKPVKRGIADAARRLYNERSVLKYDTPSHGVRFADVIALCHPTPVGEWQSALFAHCLDRRHARPLDRGKLVAAGLDRLNDTYILDAVPVDRRRAVLRGENEAMANRLAHTGVTWERLSGWLPGGMDAEAWEAVLPSMGIMAVIRNLRNIIEAGVSSATIAAVCARIADPDVVAKSRQFPYRWWSAYRNSGTVEFTAALEQAVKASITNVPALTGRTAVFIDTSASMQNTVSSRSKVSRAEVAALFGTALAKVNGRRNVTLVSFAHTWSIIEPGPSVLRTIESVPIGRDGHNTMTWTSVRDVLAKHGPFDRVVIFTDDQAQDAGYVKPPACSTYIWDLGGYGRSGVNTADPGKYVFAGFTDAAFQLIGLLERGKDAAWPWQAAADA